MLKKYLELEVLVFVLAGALVGYFVLAHMNSHQQTLIQAMQSQKESLEQQTPQPPTSQEAAVVIATPAPTVAPTVMDVLKPAKVTTKPTIVFTPAISTTSQTSPDGTRKVTIDTVGTKDGNTTYEVQIDDGPIVYSRTLPTGDSLIVPYNTWSPGDNYFFIQENSTDGTQVMVFNGSGKPLSNGNEFLDLTGVFAKDVSAAAFGSATGWAADNLIIIESKNADGTNGTSYWFGVPDQGVIPLATQF